jgi:hypothetical protein
MNNLECPYCEADLGDYVDECHDSNVDYEYECPKCGKSFIFTIEYYPSFTSNKADCLNGEEHQFEDMVGFPEEYFKGRKKCKDCGKEIRE